MTSRRKSEDLTGHAAEVEKAKPAKIEQLFRASELSYRRLFEAAQDGILILDAATGCITDVNPFLCHLLGYAHGEMVGKTVGELSPFKDVVSNRSILERLQKDGYVRYEDLPLEARDGRKIAVEFVCNVYDAGDKKVIQCNIRDIRERKRAEESHARLATAVEQSGETILITDIEGTILYANPAFEKTSGYNCTEAIGQNARLLKSGNQGAEFYRRMWQTLELGQIWTGHFVNRRKDGTLVEEDATISPVRNAAGTVFNYVAAMRDVTRQMQLEKQLHQRQRMESISQLAGGVAHDFNNILGGTLMNLGLLLQRSDLTLGVKETLREIESETIRAVNLTRQLLLFSQRPLARVRPLDLNEFITDLMKMLRRLLPADIELTFRGLSEEAWVSADVGMLEQVMMNFCLNSRDAMPKGGALTLGVKLVDLPDGTAEQHPAARPGRFVVLSITDNGCGMNKMVLDKIFEPFFTTKEVGKGAGLGLSTVYGIVDQHRGWVEVESEVGRGSSFRVYIPAGTTPLETCVAFDGSEEIKGGSETILLVEDELPVRRVAALCLRKLGYGVLEAGDGLEALAIWRDHQERIALLLTDMVMPGDMTGLDLAVRLKKEKNSLIIIISSGYSAELAGGTLIAGQEVNCLPKPYQGGALAKMVRICLDQR
jgi:PAS domain S-box-containing protein